MDLSGLDAGEMRQEGCRAEGLGPDAGSERSTSSGPTMNKRRQDLGENHRYLPIEDYGLIGNLRTTAMVGIDGSCDFLCWGAHDSPSIFARLLDAQRGGYFGIHPKAAGRYTTKQQYLPSSAILQTKFIGEEGAMELLDFFPRPKNSEVLIKCKKTNTREQVVVQDELKKWYVRRVECIRGSIDFEVEIFPAFDYARQHHTVELHNLEHGQSKAVSFHAKDLHLQVDVTIDKGDDSTENCLTINFELVKHEQMLSEGVVARVHLEEGQAISFVLRDDIPNHVTPDVTPAVLDVQQNDTMKFWANWLGKSKYKGRWREVVSRSLMILKLLTYEPTGAIVAAPTFSIPEAIGGARNWDYRFCWVRDSSFVIYIFLRMGFTEEADDYMNFISTRFRLSRGPDGALPIMFTIHGETDIPEVELAHLTGYRNSAPVRIGNGAAYHQQFDIYGELMDGIYLYNKYGKPVTWDQWVSIREILDYVLTIWKEPDMSIWEVRNNKQHFIYSKIMMWVAFDRGLRLSEKRNLPCPNRVAWLAARDAIYEEVMNKGYSQEHQTFIQSYNSTDELDASILIAPLVFFITPNDPRFTRTLDKILLSPEKGGLTSTSLVYRYNTEKSEDGVGGHEGAFSMCTFWAVEAMTRAGMYEKRYLDKAVAFFENILQYSNHLGMFSEEIARTGEQLGNTPQAFSHLALISAAFNIDRASEFYR